VWPTAVSAVISTAIAVGAVSALSLIGLLALSVEEARVQALVPVLTSLAAGALTGGALFDLVPEAAQRGASWLSIAMGLAAGFAGFWALERWLHHASAGREARPGARRNHPIVLLNFIGDSLHNAVDGSIIAVAFLATRTVGIVTTVAIVLHEIPRELGSFGVFLEGGLSVRRAAVFNALTGMAALSGAAITLAIGTRTMGVATALLPIAAGTFLYIVASIIPQAIVRAPSTADRGRRILLALIALVVTAVAAHLG
jgi:zinc and cadmium transporter